MSGFDKVFALMPIIKAAKKSIRADQKKAVFNLRRNRAMKDVIKEIDKLVSEGKLDDAQNKLSEAYKAIDKAAKMNTIKENTASRKKSRLAAKIRRAKETK
jgi:small subunit ribosomal protein S20